ncbi:O-antigen ligase family protein [Shewanella sp. KCT]|uniref:O-antigen ligase family protein n=1 Tax=Shewanella sp. KCT TaxID=2569535 RepID=UPI001181F459|nr:O-antigen ligase family protein [Shewanella sp. KCT]TVP10615.1 capsular biosynthesis protein [Shewanella sp. KCT]
MDTQTYHAANSDEKLVYKAITWTYGFWLLGAMYLVAPVIGWVLLLRMLKRYTFDGAHYRISMAQKAWLLGMFVMLLVLIIGHLEQALGIPKLIKSSIGWAKGWALIAIFPLLGALDIRPSIIYRALCVVGKHTLMLLPLFVIAWLIKLPSTLYVSPLSIVGGPGPEFFSVSLYEIDPGSGTPRWRLFTPWAPALGLMGNLVSLGALQELTPKFRRYGLGGGLMMLLISQSRLAIICYLFILGFFALIRWHRSPWLYLLASPVTLLGGMVGTQVIESIDNTIHAVKAARAGSTRVRQELANIALERWANEAVLWGHGIVERGPHLVEYMPIGSHHTWYGLLFVKGIVGAIALALPLGIGILSLLRPAFNCTLCATALAFLSMLLLYTFGENLEILAYLFWPGLILVGLAHKQAAKDDQIGSQTEAATPATASQPI